MKSRVISKIITILLIGILAGAAIYYDHVTRGQLGRADYLAKEAIRFDKFYAKPPSLALEMTTGVIAAGGLFGLYELIAFGFRKILKKSGDDAAS